MRLFYFRGGAVLFRISKSKAHFDAANDVENSISEAKANLLSQFCLTDHWSANLSNAMVRLGELARNLHGLPPERSRYGLLELVRCYNPRNHDRIIKLFERAASEQKPFHFSSELGSGNETRIVHCFGGYRMLETGDGEELFGVFIFSRDLYEMS